MSNTETTPKATPAAKKLANDNGIDLTEVEGTGKTGIKVIDVELAIANRDAAPTAEAPAKAKDESSDKREAPAERWERLAAEATATSAADVLDGKANGNRVVITLTGNDKVIADVTDDGFVKFVYANSGKLGGMLAKRPGMVFPMLHEAARREMPGRPTAKTTNAFGDVVAAARKNSDMARKAANEVRQNRLKENQARLDNARTQIEAAGDFDLKNRLGQSGRELGDGVGVGRTRILQDRQRPIDATVAILFERDGRTLLAAVGADPYNDRAIQQLLKRAIDKDGNHRRNKDGGLELDRETGEPLGFISWRVRLDDDHQMRMVELGAKYYKERVQRGKELSEAKRQAELVASSDVEELVAELEETVAILSDDETMAALTEAEAEVPSDSDGAALEVDGELEAVLIELKAKGFASGHGAEVH